MDSDGVPEASGIELFKKFAEWFCRQPHPYKVLIAGNHDGAMEAMGAELIRNILSKYGGDTVVYLEHETATVGELKVFGSPFGWWEKNNAFSWDDSMSYESVEEGTHIFVTDFPPSLPSRDQGQRVNERLIQAIVRSKAVLSVSGHCHWAYGAYCTSIADRTMFVVASNCGGWKPFASQVGTRLDIAWDEARGGYNYVKGPILVDINVQPPKSGLVWKFYKMNGVRASQAIFWSVSDP